jgi:hypothetical protein
LTVWPLWKNFPSLGADKSELVADWARRVLKINQSFIKKSTITVTNLFMSSYN